MKIMQGGSGREDTHWWQCFEEFYGSEYCKNLRKDLEKLKDEFYDGNPQRFQREWVLPTAILLRRMRFMGFPVRTREYVLIHLYNPVDSMSSGEMHFQVGRKIPGTLTLKFTKQNTGGAFVIQPKTLSAPDEVKLNEDPVRYFDEVRREMRESSVDSAVQLTTLVLMTDLCKLERKSLKDFLQSMSKNENRVPPPASTVFPDIPPSCPPTSVPFNSGHWAALAVPNMFNPESVTRPDANFPFPWNFCVKNYVNYSSRDGKPTTEMGVSMQNPNVGATNASSYNTGQFTAVGNTFRQNRSSTWHSEPEENDETLNMFSANEQQWDRRNRTPAQGVEEIQRRMSDSKLWDAPKPPSTTTTPEAVQKTTPYPSAVATSESAGNRQENQFASRQPLSTMATKQAVVSSSDVRTKVTEDYAGEASDSPLNKSSPEIVVNDGRNCNLPLRRDSETRTSLTDQYVTGTSPSTNYNSYGLCCPPPEGATSPSPLNFPNERRTSHTEVYAGEVHHTPPNGAGGGKNPFSGAFTEAMNAARHSHVTNGGHFDSRGRLSPRATTIEDYTGNELTQNTRQHLPTSNDAGTFRQRASSFANQLTVPAPGNVQLDDCNDRTRTSSLDAYVGDSAQNSAQRISGGGGIGKFHSTGDLNRLDRQSLSTSPAAGRTTAVDEYLGESNGHGEPSATSYVQRYDQPRQSTVVHFRSPAASYSGSSSYDSSATNGYDSNEGFDSSGNAFESWGSHCPNQPPSGAALGHPGQQQWRAPNGGRFNGGGGPRAPELGDENEMSLLSHTSFPSWGSHHCGVNAGSNYNRMMIPLTVEEYNRNLLQDGGGGGTSLGSSGWKPCLPSDS